MRLGNFISILTIATSVYAGPIAYGLCRTGCNTLAVACYAAAGFTFATGVAGPATPAVLGTCNLGLETCSAACAQRHGSFVSANTLYLRYHDWKAISGWSVGQSMMRQLRNGGSHIYPPCS